MADHERRETPHAEEEEEETVSSRLINKPAGLKRLGVKNGGKTL